MCNRFETIHYGWLHKHIRDLSTSNKYDFLYDCVEYWANTGKPKDYVIESIEENLEMLLFNYVPPKEKHNQLMANLDKIKQLLVSQG